MAIDRIQSSQRQQETLEGLTTSDLIDRLSRFEGPPEQFLVNLLAMQCRVSSSVGGAILRMSPDGRAEILAIYPPVQQGRTVPLWLAQSVEVAPQVIAEGATAVRPVHAPEDMYGQPAERHLVMVPLRGGAGVRGVSSFVIETREEEALASSRERIELTTSLLSLYEMRLTLQQRQLDLRRLRMGLETLAAVNEQERFTSAAMTGCNEVAARWSSDRVSLGFLKGRYVQLKGMSHTEKFSRKMKLLQDIEAAMEECLDQDVEVIYPAGSEAVCVSRAARELSTRHGSTAVLSIPLRKGGDPVAVLTLERPLDRPFGIEEVESLRLTCELCTPRLVNLYERDRWFGARAAATTRKGLGKLVGPTHTWAKVTVLAVLCAILFLTLAKGDYTAQGKAVLEPTVQQTIQAPFNGQLIDVLVEPGDPVKKGDVLARLDMRDLLADLDKARADQRSYKIQAEEARGQRGKAAEAEIYEAKADSAGCDVRLLKNRIDRAAITSPIDGTVISGDLKKRIRTSVETGQELFKVAPLDTLQAELLIPEDQISDVKEKASQGLRGELALTRDPGSRLQFEVERIVPVAEVVDQKNVFRVRVRLKGVNLTGKHSWLLSGMEGVGKIHLGKRSYAWLWTHRLVNWIRMKFWV